VNGVWGPIFRVPDLQFSHPLELPFYVLLGVLCAGVGTVYVRAFYGIRDRIFRRLPVPNHLKPALGGLGVGLIALFLPQALGMGYGWAQLAIDGQLSLTLALALVAVKIVATGLTISSGGSGGVFAPSMVIGGCLGAVLGAVLHRVVPGIVTQPAAFVLVGMAAFFAGVAKAPIASLVMVSEMTTGYGLLVPLMLATAVAYLLTPRSASIYEKQVMSRADSPAHEGEFMTDVLEGIRVRDALARQMPLVTFRRNTPLREILEAMTNDTQQTFPIVGEDGSLCGVVDYQDVRLFLIEHALPLGLVVADDLRAAAFRIVTLDEDLASALRKLHAVGLEELPVVESESPGKVIAVLSRRELVAAYHDQMYKQDRLADL
jgi:CIC family chloride channel protein